jgi:hypothetical protein
LLLPPSLHDWLPENHLARFLVDVVNALDLEAIYAGIAASSPSRRWPNANPGHKNSVHLPDPRHVNNTN